MITLLLGGARSGKSAAAEAMVAHAGGPVTYVATSDPGGDTDFLGRIEQHRRRRPSGWTTIECGTDLARTLQGIKGAVLIDSLGAWLSLWPDFEGDVDALLDALGHVNGDVVIVSDEVGLGVHPSSDVGRAFRDALGSVNQLVAERADRVFLVVAGQLLQLKGAPS
jgi:adenosyl cobinamide kinase/adenosyl cobinamide phosphate guanylyltransferase